MDKTQRAIPPIAPNIYSYAADPGQIIEVNQVFHNSIPRKWKTVVANCTPYTQQTSLSWNLAHFEDMLYETEYALATMILTDLLANDTQQPSLE